MSGPSAPAGSVYADIFAALDAAGAEYAGATDKGGLWTCPVHDDATPSLAVDVGRKRPIFYCFPCCGDSSDEGTRRDFLRALRDLDIPMDAGQAVDVDWGDPAPMFTRSTGGRVTVGAPVSTFTYGVPGSNGKPRRSFRVQRFEGVTDAGKKVKSFIVQRWEDGRWIAGWGTTERTPYRYERFASWPPGEPVYLVEGEKAAEALIEAGKRATTFQGGTNAPFKEGWAKRYGFDRFEVRIWPDADEAGVEWARARAEELEAAGVRVSFWGSREVIPKDDAYDVLERKGKVRRLTDEDLDALAALKPLPTKAEKAAREVHVPLSLTLPGGLVISSVTGLNAAQGPTEPSDDDPTFDPYPVAAGVEPRPFSREYLRRNYTDPEGVLTLRYTDMTYWLWEDTHYRPLTPEEVQARLARDLDGCSEITADGEVRVIKVKRTTKAELLSAIQDLTLVSKHGAGTLLSAKGGVPFQNGWLDVETGELVPLSPARDLRWVVPGNYDPKAGKPAAWFEFLDSLGWTVGTDERRLLRQWFGYLLSGETRRQKALMMIGPTRSGKGTILGVCGAMLGDGAVGLDLTALSSDFGLAGVVGKSLATIGEARFEMKTDKAMIGRVLSLTGEDEMPVNRKYKDVVSIVNTARLMVATNEVPALIEASSAFSDRFLFLRFTKSFLGHEDLGLRRRIMAEIPGIVRWALAGLDDLNTLNHFTEPESGTALKHQMKEIGNPITSFVEEVCELDPTAWISSEELYDHFATWADRSNNYKASRIVFSRDLSAAYNDDQVRTAQKKIGGRSLRGFVGLKLRVR